VGLLQREIEAGGVSTIILSNIPALTSSVNVPRLAAIEYPFGRTFGMPGDADGQRCVLRAALQALVAIQSPGGIRHLPFKWNETPKAARSHPPEAPPISQLIRRNMLLFKNLLDRNPP